MKKGIFAAVFVLAGCADQTAAIPISHLVPDNQAALRDGPVTGMIYARQAAFITTHYAPPSQTVTFTLANGETLNGTMSYNHATSTTSNIFGEPIAQTTANDANITMLATDGKQTMDCEGTMDPPSLDLTCKLTDGAIYRDVH